MSIRDEVKRAEEGQEIHRVFPESQRRVVRTLYVSAPIYERAFLSVDVAGREKRRWFTAGAELRRFADDKVIEVRDERREHSRGTDFCQLARLDPISREVWEF